MKSENQNKIGARNQSAFARIEKIHPFKMLLYLFLLGIGILFLVLLVGFLHSETAVFRLKNIPFPKYFSISTLILVFSSYTLSKVSRFYRQDKLRKMIFYLGYSLFLGLSFVFVQLVGWYELVGHAVFLKRDPFGSYLYLISFLHAMHLLFGIIFMFYIFFRTSFAASDGVRTLVFIRDPYRKLQLSLLGTYWHYMAGLWLVIFVVFLFWF